MSQVETRQLDRDSLFLMANIKVDGDQSGLEYRVKVRNLSSGGMMAEGVVEAARGASLKVELRNIGWVKGSVAWRQGNRFGIAFDDEIDPRTARGHVVSDNKESDTPRFVRPPLKNTDPEPSRVRKI